MNTLLNLHGAVVYVLVGLVVFAEDALFVGFVLPGETAAVLGGVASQRGHVSLVGMLVVVVLAAIAGDSVGYEVGARYGTRLLSLSVLRRRQKRIDSARQMLARRGAPAVFLGRFVAFFRAVMPFLSGTSKMPYRRFLAWNALGGLAWGTAAVLVGYLAGDSYGRVEKYFGRVAALVVVAVVIVALVVWRVRKYRHDHAS
jgi:membrane-associated protein